MSFKWKSNHCLKDLKPFFKIPYLKFSFQKFCLHSKIFGRLTAVCSYSGLFLEYKLCQHIIYMGQVRRLLARWPLSFLICWQHLILLLLGRPTLLGTHMLCNCKRTVTISSICLHSPFLSLRTSHKYKLNFFNPFFSVIVIMLPDSWGAK